LEIRIENGEPLSTKYQINLNVRNSKSQTPSPHPSPLRGEGEGEGWSLEIGIYLELGIWCLDFDTFHMWLGGWNPC
jgi:hypothetical protein